MTARDTLPALSIRAPWWWAILYAGKDIENRNWYARYRGPLFIHASSWWSLKQVNDTMGDVRDMYLRMASPPKWTDGWTFRKMQNHGGHIVGVCDMVDCVPQSDSPWFVGHWGFVLRNPRPITLVKCKGQLGFFPAPAEAQRQLEPIP
jgi:hypothetical protein